jgi:hypothetical protein
MKGLIYIALLFTGFSFGQAEVGRLFEELPSDSLIVRSAQTHTSLKPAIRQANFTKNYVRFSALVDLNYVQQNEPGYKLGLGGEVSAVMNDKWYFQAAAIQGVSNLDSIFEPKTYITSPQTNTDLYTDIRTRVSYTPNHIFNFQVGLDHNFIGEGSRSLFLSDYGKPYPFGLIRAKFWRFEYSVLYQFMKERDQNRWEGKFASSHHISFNPTKWLNIGIFESVIFQPKDTLLQRGFDVEYLNPFVFYRPQEYSLGSSDNVLLGMEISAHINDRHTIYSQVILDEFYLSELRAKTGWWANKFGAQLGVKGRFEIGKHRFFYRGEYSFVRPYTYSHISEELNHGNQGYSLAHPYGSNFMEILGELKWNLNKWSAKLFMNYAVKGGDQDGFSYGGDIYQPYVNRPFETGHYTGQGNQVNRFNAIVSGSYQLMEQGNLQVFMENHFRFATNQSSMNYMLVVGIRSQLWNDYRNY